MTFELRFKDKKETGPGKSKGERLRLKELECKGQMVQRDPRGWAKRPCGGCRGVEHRSGQDEAEFWKVKEFGFYYKCK